MDLDEALLEQLTPSRRAHSRAVAEAAASRARYVPDADQQELITAALLHDVGYAVPVLNFHPIDGARHLQTLGYSPLICHLVATHTAAHLEAEDRGIPVDVFEPFRLGRNTRAHREVLMWADLTTSPTGSPCTVSDRLEEITRRYQAPHPVHQYVTRWKSTIAAAVAQPQQHQPHVLDHSLFDTKPDATASCAEGREAGQHADIPMIATASGGLPVDELLSAGVAHALTGLGGTEAHPKGTTKGHP